MEVTENVGDAGPVPVPTLKVVGLPRVEDLADFSVMALKVLVTLTFDLSTSKLGHESPVPRTSLTPNFSFLRNSELDLGSGT